MSNFFLHLCLILAFLFFSACLGGPKVDPPEITGSGVAGASAHNGQPNTGEYNDDTAVDNAMDSGITPPSSETSGGNTGGEGKDSDTFRSPDSGLIDEDEDAGPTHEP